MGLKIQLLGGFRVTVEDSVVEESRWVRKKAETLVKLLAVQPGHEIQREKLLEMLWPELDYDQALNNFHKAVHAARRALEPELKAGAASRFLSTSDRVIALHGSGSGGLQIDAEEFEREARKALAASEAKAAEIERALSLMTGVFLPADQLEDWTAVRREKVASLHQELLMRLALLQERAGESRYATELLGQAVAVQPANEEAHRRLMRLYAATGSRHLAVNQFRACAEILRRELDAEPESATVRLFEQIQSGQMMGLPEEPSKPVVVGTVGPGMVAGSSVAGAKTELKTEARQETKTVAAGLSRRKLLLTGGGLVASGAVVYLGRNGMGPAADRKAVSLAVLPFSTGRESPIAHIADGVTEGLIGTLSQLPRLRVMARSTVFAYKDRAADPRMIGKALAVGSVLTGSVEQNQENLLIAVELVDAADGARLWGKRYQIPPSELTTITTRVASDVAGALSYGFESAAQRQQMTRLSTENPKAYELYLRGRHQWNQREEAGFRKAIAYFEQAIAVDPRYALAYSGLADCYGLLSYDSAPPSQNLPKARAMAVKALELDDQLAEAHTSLAMLKALYDWDWPQAESAFRRAIALKPGHATAHHWYAVFLNAQGRIDEAQAEFAKALDLDPLSSIINTNAAYPAHYQRQYAKAIPAYRKVLDLDPAFQTARHDLILALEQTGAFQEAAKEGTVLLQQNGEDGLLGRIRLATQRGGYQAGLKEWRESVEARARTQYVSPAQLAELCIRTGDKDSAFRHLEQAVAERSAPLAYLKVNPLYDLLRNDPRFATLLRQVGLG